MTRHLVQGHYGAADRANLAAAGADEKQTRFDLVAYDKVLDFGIGAALTDLKAKKVFPNEIALDLVVTAAQVYAADTRISRATESEDAWTREIRVVIPVSDVARWNVAVPVLERMLNFLTGDRWTIQFCARPPRFAEIVPQPDLIVPPVAGVSLFSGGLDSLIGAIDQLEVQTRAFVGEPRRRAGRQQGAGRLLRPAKEALSQAAVRATSDLDDVPEGPCAQRRAGRRHARPILPILRARRLRGHGVTARFCAGPGLRQTLKVLALAST
jgi:hypothetical protein